MSRTLSTDLEHSSEIPTWIVLVCSGLALVLFFGWIVKDLSALVSPDQGNSLLVQPLSETGSVSDIESDTLNNSARAIELANSQAINRFPSGSNLSLKSDKAIAEQKGSPAPESARQSTAQSIEGIAGQTTAGLQQSGQSSTEQLQRFARQKAAEPASYQQPATELSATEQNSQRGGAEEHESPAYAGPHQSETTQSHPNTSAAAPLDSGLTEASGMENDRAASHDIVERTAVSASEPARIVAMQEAVVSAEGFDETEAGPTKELPVRSKVVVSPPNSIARMNKAEQATKGSVNTTLSHAQRPPADLGALRQLLAEAAAINETEDEQVRAERERREALESLGILSAAIQFAPGSKVASESVTSTLNQIQRILADYPETMINVIVATNESGDEKQNMRLSQERGRTLIARLVNNGLAFSRFSLEALTDEQLPVNTHMVEIQAHSKS